MSLLVYLFLIIYMVYYIICNSLHYFPTSDSYALYTQLFCFLINQLESYYLIH